MRRKLRTDEELRRASDHLYYEIGMFQRLVDGLASGIAGDSIINNALLESFGIHVRALIWFFYAKNPREDDVVAEDFFPDLNEWQTARPSITEVLKKAKKRADKEIAHLTYARLNVSPEQKLWEFLPISEDMNKVVDKFFSLVSERVLGESWNEFKRQHSAKRQSGG